MPRSRFTNMSYASFDVAFACLLDQIEMNLCQPWNPDDMLAEGQASLAELKTKSVDASMADYKAIELDNDEDQAFEKLTKELANAKTAVDVLANKKHWVTLDFPVKMPRSRAKVKEAANAILLAWDEHSADPELAHVIPKMTELRAAFDTFVAAWDAQQNAKRIKKENYRAAREARAKCEKFVSRVKKYLSLHLDPDDPKWGLYGFERREKE